MLPGSVMRLQLIVTRPGELPGLIVPATITSPLALMTPSLPVSTPFTPIANVLVLIVLLLIVSVAVPPVSVSVEVAPTPTKPALTTLPALSASTPVDPG